MNISMQHIQDYHRYLIQEEKSKATIEKYMRDIMYFYQFLGDSGELDKENVIRFKQHLLTVYTVNSANSMIAALNGFMAFLDLHQLRVKRYKTQRKLFCSEETELSKDEYMLLLAACEGNERLNLILQTICGTGIRISELEYFTVAAVKRGKIEVFCKNKVRIVLIPELLRSKLLAYIEKRGITEGYVFITRSGKPVNRSNVWTQMKRLCQKTGIPESKVFPHNLRHLFARTYYTQERDITRLADVLGHSSIETTRVYTISTGREHEKQLSGLGLVV